MKLHQKLSLVLFGGLLVIVVLSQTLQQARHNAILQNVSARTLATLENRELRSAENIADAVGFILADTIQRGEMDRFEQFLAAQGHVENLLEFSLYDAKGVARFSADKSWLRRSLPPDVTAQVLRAPNRLVRRTNEAFEIYQPQVATQACMECHNRWKVGQIAGVVALRFSATALVKARNDAAAELTGLRRANRWWTVGTVGLMAAVFTGLAYFSVRQLITRPLQRLATGLDQVARGELSARVRVDSMDEIGELAAAANVSAGSEQLNTTAQALATGSSEQAASVEEVSASIKQTSASIQQNTENARQTDLLALNAAIEAAGSTRQGALR